MERELRDNRKKIRSGRSREKEDENEWGGKKNEMEEINGGDD